MNSETDKGKALFFGITWEHMVMSEIGLQGNARLEQDPEVGESRGPGIRSP